MFLVLSLLFFAVLHLPFFRRRAAWNTLRERGAWALALSLMTAGALHFVFPNVFVAMVPDYLPAQHELVFAGGLASVAGGIGVLWKRLRRFASLGVVGMLAAFLPANLQLATQGAHLPEGLGEVPANHWLGWASMPMQLALMWWSWRVGRVRTR